MPSWGGGKLKVHLYPEVLPSALSENRKHSFHMRENHVHTIIERNDEEVTVCEIDPSYAGKVLCGIHFEKLLRENTRFAFMMIVVKIGGIIKTTLGIVEDELKRDQTEAFTGIFNVREAANNRLEIEVHTIDGTGFPHLVPFRFLVRQNMFDKDVREHYVNRHGILENERIEAGRRMRINGRPGNERRPIAALRDDQQRHRAREYHPYATRQPHNIDATRNAYHNEEHRDKRRREEGGNSLQRWQNRIQVISHPTQIGSSSSQPANDQQAHCSGSGWATEEMDSETVRLNMTPNQLQVKREKPDEAKLKVKKEEVKQEDLGTSLFPILDSPNRDVVKVEKDTPQKQITGLGQIKNSIGNGGSCTNTAENGLEQDSREGSTLPSLENIAANGRLSPCTPPLDDDQMDSNLLNLVPGIRSPRTPPLEDVHRNDSGEPSIFNVNEKANAFRENVTRIQTVKVEQETQSLSQLQAAEAVSRITQRGITSNVNPQSAISSETEVKKEPSDEGINNIYKELSEMARRGREAQQAAPFAKPDQTQFTSNASSDLPPVPSGEISRSTMAIKPAVSGASELSSANTSTGTEQEQGRQIPPSCLKRNRQGHTRKRVSFHECT